MIWRDIADWIGPTPNRNPGGMSNIVGVVLHIQDGSEAGTEAWQENPKSQISSHFLAPKRGRLKQMVDTADKAWCEAAGNAHWLSIECEGRTGDSLTADQIESCAQVLAKAHQLYRVPLASTDSPGVGGLGWHGMGGQAWGGHLLCPGDPVKSQRPRIILRAQLLADDRGTIMDDKAAYNIEHYLYKLYCGQDADQIWAPDGTRVTVKNQIAATLAALKADVEALKATTAGLKPGDKLAMTVDTVVVQ